MNYLVILSPDAADDLAAVIRRYFDVEPQLSSRFSSEIKALLRRLAQNPYQFPVSHKSFRKALQRFRYSLYFTLIAKEVFVMTIIHQRRLRPWDQV